MSEKHPCDMPIDFYAGVCPVYGSIVCPKTVPGAVCGVDMQYTRELIKSKYRYYARRATR